METTDVALILQRLLAITDTGLSFAASEFDRERYADIRDNLNQLLSETSHLDQEELSNLLRPTDFYATPLVDVRAFIVQQGKICLVRGQQEETWALPGGFCEVGLSTKENVLKEIQEETGFQASVVHLLAVFDSNKFQPQSKQYVKLVFECRLEEGDFQPNLEISELNFFDPQNLPLLSEKRITKEQMQLLWEIYQGKREQYLD
ncbi:NUDIX hydrolase N-terminal domain-containing protein [Streptococcus cristatus]|uniref:NUDIX hydrolase N-terminal domain-containing protein n=1 Tax=Streptococcus cristatus TaxID=45634 RepID=UPI0022836CA4|nr:NUDIX hydrolase N-terminal domain-containing protein [Streptococcus cristatus]MCY7218197.1 NUDIX hydrolase [Streptococcus cristatus]